MVVVVDVDVVVGTIVVDVDVVVVDVEVVDVELVDVEVDVEVVVGAMVEDVLVDVEVVLIDVEVVDVAVVDVVPIDVVVVPPLAKAIDSWAFCGPASMAAKRVHGRETEQVLELPPAVNVSDTVTLTGPKVPEGLVVKVPSVSEQSSVPMSSIGMHCWMDPVPFAPNPVPVTATIWPPGRRFVFGVAVRMVPAVSAPAIPAAITKANARAAVVRRTRGASERANLGHETTGDEFIGRPQVYAATIPTTRYPVDVQACTNKVAAGVNAVVVPKTRNEPRGPCGRLTSARRRLCWALGGGPMRRTMCRVLFVLAVSGAALAPAPAWASTSGEEVADLVIVARGESGSRVPVSSALAARGVYNGVGRIVELDNLPGDGDDVSRDDIVSGRERGTFAMSTRT